MKIITGLGRCGTSILIKYLKESGFCIGQNVNWHDEARAGYELSTFYFFADDLYHRYCKKGLPINVDDIIENGDYWSGLSYREALNKVDKDYRQLQVDVVKDPRITWHPDIIEAIWKVRKDIKLIICHRNIESVYKSRNSLSEKYNDPKPRKEIWEYQVDFAEFYTRVVKLNIPHIILFYPNFLKDFEFLWSELNKVGLSKDKINEKDVFNKIVDKNLLKER